MRRKLASTRARIISEKRGTTASGMRVVEGDLSDLFATRYVFAAHTAHPAQIGHVTFVGPLHGRGAAQLLKVSSQRACGPVGSSFISMSSSPSS